MWRFGIWCSCSSIAAGDGMLTPLPKPSIDTGMGLERIACVLQGVLSNFDTDLFMPLIAEGAELAGLAGGVAGFDCGRQVGLRSDAILGYDEKTTASLRIIADHARCATFLISDGVLPANEGRGYVLRKILRRGIRHGRLLGQEKPFMHEMVFAVRDEMQVAYPELKETAERVAKVVLAEEQQFARTLELGLRQMNEETLRSGAAAFHLYETFGMPLDFMVDAARDAGIAFDMEGFEAAKEEEQARARASWKGGSQKSAAPVYRELAKTEFEGYSALRVDGAKVLALVKDGVGVPELKAGETGEVVLDATSFYADSGGQVGDVGWLYSGDHNSVVATVSGLHEAGAGRVCAQGEGEADDCGGRYRGHGSRCGEPARDGAEPYGDASAARGVARGAGQACEAGGKFERCDAAAVRLFAFCGRGGGGVGGGGEHREHAGAGEYKGARRWWMCRSMWR